MGAPEAIDARHERWQPPGEGEQWSDSFYFGGGDGRGLAFYTRIGRRPNEGLTEGALGLWLPGQGFALCFGRAPVSEPIASGPVEFECLAPLREWELHLRGPGRLFDRAEHLATARDRYREVAVEGRLRFSAWHDAIAFRTGLTDAVAAAHYEQPGAVAGELVVDGVRREVEGAGLRDHSWGVRDWQRVPYWRWFGLVVDPRTFVLVNNVGLEGGGETAGGFLMRDGLLGAVVAAETDSELDPEIGAQRRFDAHVTDEHGRETRLEGRALEVAPLRQRRAGRLTLVNEALTEYRWEGHTGVGISEYLVQVDPERTDTGTAVSAEAAERGSVGARGR